MVDAYKQAYFLGDARLHVGSGYEDLVLHFLEGGSQLFVVVARVSGGGVPEEEEHGSVILEDLHGVFGGKLAHDVRARAYEGAAHHKCLQAFRGKVNASVILEVT